VAEAGGFEPPHGGIKIRRRTDLPCSGTGRCIRRRNSSLWPPRRLDPNVRRDAPLSFAQFESGGIGLRGGWKGEFFKVPNMQWVS
jgi:hypothetical protein